MSRFKALVKGIVLAGLWTAPLWAQTAQITGRITDSSGAVVVGAKVISRNVATGVDRATQSNETGYYTIPLLTPGEYRLSVELRGFRPVVRSGVVLVVDQHAELDFALEVGDVSEQVEVTAAVAQLNTAESSQGQVIGEQTNRRVAAQWAQLQRSRAAVGGNGPAARFCPFCGIQFRRYARYAE